MPRKAHVSQAKKETVKELAELLDKYPVVGIASIYGYPAQKFQKLRKVLGKDACIKVTKLNLFKLALKKHPELKELEGHLNQPTAFIFTDMNPFKLYKILKENSSKDYAKPGQIAEEDIIIPPGDTGIPPGPALGDLRNAGIDARIEGGSIKVTKESIVVRKGEPVTSEAANALNKLGIKPFEVMLSLQAAYENGAIFQASILDISEEETLQSLQQCYLNAFNLSFNAGYYTNGNIKVFVGKAFQNAKALGLEANILNKATVGGVLAKASAQAKGLSIHVKEPEATPGKKKKETAEETKEEKAEEKPPKEEKPAEKEEKPKEELKKEETKEKKVEKPKGKKEKPKKKSDKKEKKK